MPALTLDRRSALLVLILAVGFGIVAGFMIALLPVDGHGRSLAVSVETAGEMPVYRFDLMVLAALAALVAAAALLIYSRGKGQAAIISDREAELARMSWRLDFALVASEIGAWDVDLSSDKMRWDARTRALFDAPERDGYYSEKDWLRVLHPDDRERAQAAANAAVDSDGRFVQDYRVVLSDGTVRHVRDMAAVYEEEDGTKRLAGLVWDVTRDIERQQELQLRRAEAEEAALVKAQFLATMSHEIRTPMTGVLGMLDLLSEETLSEKQAERLGIARVSARGLMQILNDVLEFSRLEAQHIELHLEPADPRRLIDNVIGLMTPVAEQRGLTLIAETSGGLPEFVSCDEMRLSQVLTNLTSNAVKFTERGHVVLRAAWDDGTLRFDVEDTGVGIGAADRERLFDKFFRVDSSHCRHSSGTGLGLAICRELVDLMGGTITVDSTPGEGSVFSVCIPAPECAPAAIGETEPGAQEYPDEPMHLLLAEDNATNQYLIRTYLEQAGHSVQIVENGNDAVAAVEAGAFDAVLMDVQMPQMDGTSATRAIRALPGAVAAIPVIALTASALSGDRETYVAAGMNDLVAKPIDPTALHAALNRARQHGFRPDMTVNEARRLRTG